MKKLYFLLAGVLLALTVAGPVAHAQSRHAAAPAGAKIKLVNVTKIGNTLAAGNKACPGQAYYLYSGGFQDTYGAPADAAYPGPNLAAFIPPGGPVVPYDVNMVDGRFGDSFNLQNTRGVCYAIIQYAATATNTGSANDGLTFGHVGNGGTPFTVVGQIINPGSVGGVQSYALDPTGLNLLSQQTGFFLNKTPSDSILDVYLQDDTMIDFFRAYVWYGPNCTANGSC